jgi:hypothetical protein
MTSEGLGEVFKGDSADTCAGKFPLVSMGGRANGQACADGSEDPHRRERKFSNHKLSSVRFRDFTTAYLKTKPSIAFIYEKLITSIVF